MNAKELTLIVPESKAIRDEIRKTIEDFFLKNEVIPPVSYEKLLTFAKILSDEHNWGEHHFSFVMLCCGNAIWRKVMEAIPYHRRVLLLPECLKNSKKCKAERDEFGLLCRECGSCSISGILQYAENLGYIVLITEGTTITTKLIESGEIDAVIGTGCLEVLQKMFRSVTKYAIPGIAIPLLYDGCIDTKVDENWLREEISNYTANKDIKLINLNQLKDRVREIFNESEIKKITRQTNTKTEKIARGALTERGNRWRPFLTALVYEALCDKPDKELLNRIAISVECFHKASLIHDDIEDNDLTRDGHETIHALYGIPIALNVGDLLIGEGYRLLAESNLGGKVMAKCIKIVSAGHIALTIGQGEELFNENKTEVTPLDKILSIFENKTSAAFNVSVQLGAVIGSASDETKTQLKAFSKYIGIAYQIKDDINDYKGDSGDILSRNFSVLLPLLLEELDGENKTNALNFLKNNDKVKIFNLIEQYKIVQKTEELLKLYIDKSYQSLESISVIGLKLALHELLGIIFDDYI